MNFHLAFLQLHPSNFPKTPVMIYDLLRSPLHHLRPSLVIDHESSLSLSQQPAAGHPIRSLIHPSKKRTTMAVKIRAARKNVPQPLPTFFGSKKIRETNGRTDGHTALYI
jgi:hypothetical protein